MPNEIPPVYLDELKIWAPHYRGDTPGMKHGGGYIEAVHAKTGKRKWLLDLYTPLKGKIAIYDVKPSPSGTFVAELEVEKGNIYVTDSNHVGYCISKQGKIFYKNEHVQLHGEHTIKVLFVAFLPLVLGIVLGLFFLGEINRPFGIDNLYFIIPLAIIFIISLLGLAGIE